MLLTSNFRFGILATILILSMITAVFADTTSSKSPSAKQSASTDPQSALDHELEAVPLTAHEISSAVPLTANEITSYEQVSDSLVAQADIQQMTVGATVDGTVVLSVLVALLIFAVIVTVL